MTPYARAIGAAGRAAAIRRATASYLGAHQLLDAGFWVTDRGYGIRIVLPEADLCTTGRIAAEPMFARQLRDAVGFVRTVTVRAAGQRGDLRAYLIRRCRGVSRIYERSGSGSFTSPAFTVSARRWIAMLASRQGGAQLEALSSSSREVATLTLSQPGVTSRVVRHGGRFRLRVRGRGGWTVVVLRSAL